MNLQGRVTHWNRKHPVAHTTVLLLDEKRQEVARTHSGVDGEYEIAGDFPDGKYLLLSKHFGQQKETPLELGQGKDPGRTDFDFDLGLQLVFKAEVEGKLQPVKFAGAGKRLVVCVESKVNQHITSVRWNVNPDIHLLTM